VSTTNVPANEVKMTKEEVFNHLIIMGVNHVSSNNGYNKVEPPILANFCSLPLSDIGQFWSSCNDQTKLAILRHHEKEFLSWAVGSN
jgi:hypothetical protein